MKPPEKLLGLLCHPEPLEASGEAAGFVVPSGALEASVVAAGLEVSPGALETSVVAAGLEVAVAFAEALGLVVVPAVEVLEEASGFAEPVVIL